ncbi:His-Xaa-Ser system protein HxsD [Clostridium beijerinckii]|uniref:His-Xaa-Ser system protein HxsD n=1 Tax=Clostridium beijerinckii TaxID=1520 RepID=UPI00047EDC6A|nr:His-Xaa-Ser system protein HxsD [Clostridium beijerinckii]
MDKKHIIKDENKIIFYLSKDIYDVKTIMKTAYNFIEEFYIILNYINDNIEVILEGKSRKNSNEMEKYQGEFYNELLRQNVRYIVAQDTKNIRELVMGRALYDTCIEYEDNVQEDELNEKNADLNDQLDILVNWFDKNEV